MNRSSRYRLKLSRREHKKMRLMKWLVLLVAILGVGLIVWLAWIRPMQKGSDVNSFEECAAAGYLIQESYPEVCLTDDGKRFVNLKKQAAHQANLDGEQELVPPSNPALLKLEIDEWDITIPLTMDTFDLTYAYFENGGEDYVFFAYKRLIRLDACKGDIGLKLSRRFVKYEPPYSESRPAPLANADKAYFYPTYADKKCYDPKSSSQAALVKEIAGDKSLIEATADLVSKLVVAPEDN